MAPKIAIEPLPLPNPEAPLLQSNSSRVSRGAFSDYLERLIAFDTKYQRVQPNFAAHFDLLRGVAFYHPDNVYTFIDSLEPVRRSPALYQLTVRLWVKGQIGVYARLMELLEPEHGAKLAQSAEAATVLDFYAAGVKTAMLEELIVLGTMEPSVAAVRSFVAENREEAITLIDRGVEVDTELTPPDERTRLQDRWRRFRQDLLKSVELDNRCASVDGASAVEGTLLVELGRHRLTLGRYRALFGGAAGEMHRPIEMRGNCARWVLFYAMADFADTLDILPVRLQKDIRVSGRIYLMGRQLAAETAPFLLGTDASAAVPLEAAKRLMQHPKVIEVKDWLLARSIPTAGGGGEQVVDEAFIDSTDWTLDRVLAPKHSIHM